MLQIRDVVDDLQKTSHQDTNAFINTLPHKTNKLNTNIWQTLGLKAKRLPHYSGYENKVFTNIDNLKFTEG